MAAIDLPDLRGKLRLDLSELNRAPAQVRAAITRMQAAANGNPVRVPVQADSDNAVTGVRQAHRAGQTEADRNPVEIPVRIDRRGLEALAQRVRDLRTVYSASLGPVRSFSTEIARMAAVAGAAATALTSGIGLVGGVVAFVSAASAAAGAAPLLASGITAVGAAVGTLKVGLSGVGDAIDKNLKGKFADLAPAADRLVATVTRLAPALLSVRNAIQQSLLAGLAEQIRPLAERYLPLLASQGRAVAGVFNGVLRSAIRDLSTSTSQWRLASVLESARRALAAFAPQVSRLPGLFLRVAEVAAPAFESLARAGAGSLGRLFDAIDRAASSGALAAGIRQGVGAVIDLGRLLGGVLGVLRGINTAATAVFGTSLVGQVAALAGQLSRLVASAPGQEFLRGLFANALPVIRQLGDLLVGSVLPGIGRLLPVVAQLATAFLTGLRPVIPVAEGLLRALGGALTAILPAVSTVAVAVGTTLAGAVHILTPVIPPLAAALASLLSPTGVLTAAMSALAPVLPILATGLGRVVTALSGGLITALSAVAPVLPLLAQAFSDLAGAVATQLASALVAISPQLPKIVGGLVALTNALVPLIGAALQLAQPLLELAASVLPALLAIVRALSGPLVFLGTVFLGVAAAVRALRILASVGSGFATVQTQLRQIGPAGNIAADALGRVKTALSIGGTVLAGLGTAGFLLKKLQDAAFDAAPGVEQTKQALLGLSDQQITTQIPTLGRDLDNMGAAVRRLADPSLGDQASKLFTNVFTLGQVDPGLLRQATQDIGSLDTALASLVQGGNQEQASAAFDRIAAAAARGGASVDQVRQVLPQYRDALAGIANQSLLSQAPMSVLEESARALGVQFGADASAAAVLRTAIDNLTGASTSALEADIAYRQSRTSVTAAVRENGRTLDLNSTAGQRNTTTFLAGITAAKAHAQAVTEVASKTKSESAAINEGSATLRGHIAQLRATAIAAGLPAAAVDDLIRKYGQVPGVVKTRIDLAIAAAEQAAARIRAQITQVRGKTVSIVVNQVGSVQAIQREIDSVTGKVVAIQVGLIRTGIRGFSHGGRVTGGTPGRDSVLALLMPGEYVETREEAERLGRHGRRATASVGAPTPDGGGLWRLHPDDLMALARALSVRVNIDGRDLNHTVDRDLGQLAGLLERI